MRNFIVAIKPYDHENQLTILFLVFSFCTTAQKANIQGWQLKDISTDGFYGISLDKAYQFLNQQKLKSTPVIVAILDDGIDTAHEDLHNILWTNLKEIPGNKKDDDGNGYVDDVHGWNFLGNPDGRNVTSNSSEWIRVYWRYKSKYEGVTVDTGTLSPKEKYDYRIWQIARGGVVGKGMKPEELNNLHTFLANAQFCDSILKPNFSNQEFTPEQLQKWKPNSETDKKVKGFFQELFTQFKLPGITNHFAMEELEKYVVGEVRRASGDKIPPEDNRKEITGDDETNGEQRSYGNSDNTNGELMHGTHLAGIIAAERDNKKGMQGIVSNVQIMMVRTSADGDEHDKDIASGIRYAVDNGAKIINMSFGKSLSPDKQFIDDAVKYALSNDVLIVQAAGNSKKEVDWNNNFPNRKILLTDSLLPNWITVGASDSAGHAAEFSNYGKQAVDIFAPGVAIYSSIPGGNKYMSWDGTSMAAPVVSGTAALLRSYFPTLNAVDIKAILEKSVTVPAGTTPNPSTKEKVTFAALCVSGGIVNAYNAVKLAVKTK